MSKLGYFRGKDYQRGFGIGSYKNNLNYQNGSGIGGYFKKLFALLKPIFNSVKDKAVPLLKSGAQAVGHEIIKSASDIAKDVLEGKNLKDSSKERLTNSIDNLAEKSKSFVGSGYKRKFKTRKINKKRKLDIFD